jgi:hypothetical protein
MSRAPRLPGCGRAQRCGAGKQLQTTGERSVLESSRAEYCHGLSRSYAACVLVADSGAELSPGGRVKECGVVEGEGGAALAVHIRAAAIMEFRYVPWALTRVPDRVVFNGV